MTESATARAMWDALPSARGRVACVEHQSKYGASVADPTAWRKDSTNIARVETALVSLMQVHAASNKPAVRKLLEQCQGDFEGVLDAINKVGSDPKARAYARSDAATPYTVIPGIQTAWARAHRVEEKLSLLDRVTLEAEERAAQPPRRGTVGAELARMRAAGLIE